jgi:spermidine synthase
MGYVELARAETPRGEIVLREQRDEEGGGNAPAVLELRINGVHVMDTQETATERRLASAALGRVDEPRAVVVGGLGLGFTTHEVLADHRVQRVVVVEIEDDLVRWMRDGTIRHGPGLLADERLTVMTADIRIAMAEATPEAYDLILLDVDNGPGFLVHEENASLYQREFLDQTRRTLRPGGALVIWSSAEAPALRNELETVFGKVTPIPDEVKLQDRLEHYWLYLARR